MHLVGFTLRIDDNYVADGDKDVRFGKIYIYIYGIYIYIYIYIYGTEVADDPCIYIKLRFVIRVVYIVVILFE